MTIDKQIINIRKLAREKSDLLPKKGRESKISTTNTAFTLIVPIFIRAKKSRLLLDHSGILYLDYYSINWF